MSYFFTVQRVRFFIFWPHIVNISRFIQTYFELDTTRAHTHTHGERSSSSSSSAGCGQPEEEEILLALQKPTPGTRERILVTITSASRYKHIIHSTNFSTFSQRVNRYVLGFSRYARRQKDSLDHGVRLERRRISGSARRDLRHISSSKTAAVTIISSSND